MRNQISFGDNVRVRSTPDTVARGLAGRVGQVSGETTPSVTGIPVIGTPASDYALHVDFDPDEDLWFAPELLEFIDHAPGTTVQLDGVPKKWTRQEDGSWAEEPAPARETTAPWWRFW